MSVDAEWHGQCQQEVLAKYPEIKQYFGAYP